MHNPPSLGTQFPELQYITSISRRAFWRNLPVFACLCMATKRIYFGDNLNPLCAPSNKGLESKTSKPLFKLARPGEFESPTS